MGLLDIPLPNQVDHLEEMIVQIKEGNMGKGTKTLDLEWGERQSPEDPIVNIDVEDELNIDSDMDDTFE